MAQKSAGGRFVTQVTGSYQKLTGSLAAYLNRPIDPRTSAVEVVCTLLIAGAVVALASQTSDPPGAERFRLTILLKPAQSLAAGMVATAVIYLALLFMVELPTGARVAGALFGATVAGAVVETFLIVQLPVPAVLAGLVIAPALVIMMRCRLGVPVCLGITGVSALLLAILRDYLRG